jgi:hypothetical protein
MAIASGIGGIIQTFSSGSVSYKSHTFTSSGVFEYTGSATGKVTASILIVGGGAGGSIGIAGTSVYYTAGNGGGAGGLIYSASFIISPLSGSISGSGQFASGSIAEPLTGSRGKWNIIVGNGGLGGNLERDATNGENSYLYSGSLSLTASYGARGGIDTNTNPGASGGGSNPTGSKAEFGDQGKDGGNQTGKSGAGGGGALSAGSNSNPQSDALFTTWVGGNGGTGMGLTIRTGSLEYYSGGGAGGGNLNYGKAAGGLGGSGVGGDGGQGPRGKGSDGVTNTGAGGGGGAISEQSANWGNGGNGGSGVVIITYQTGSL